MSYTKIIKYINIALFLMVVFSIYAMFKIKDRYQDLNFQLSQIKNNIKSEKNQLKILKAEYAHLTSPERIEKLAFEYTNLKKVSLEQYEQNPISNIEDAFVKLSKSKVFPSKKSRKWRYKDPANLGIKTVSYKKK